jgi:hypothetical protein
MPDLAWWLENFKQSAFRLETLPQYLVPDEEEWFAAWKRDASLPDLSPGNDEWLRLVSEARVASKTIQRVRLVSSPFSDYERFELALYPPSIEAGEDIRIIASSQNMEELRGWGDYWLIDETIVFLLHYDNEGHFLGTECPADVVPYLHVRDLALSCCIGLHDFQEAASRQPQAAQGSR